MYLTRQPLEIFALELEQDATLMVQVGGGADTLDSRSNGCALC